MEYLVAVILGVIVAGIGKLVGFDRDRAFYPTVLIVIGSYYSLFAVMGESHHPALEIETAVGLVFVALAILGFKKSMWLAAAGIFGHGLFDFFVHPSLVTNPGMPVWWPGFCGTIDILLGAWLAFCLWMSPSHGKQWSNNKGKIMSLKWIAPVATLASALIISPASYGQDASACHTGKLLDVREEIEYVPTVQVGRVQRNGNKDWTTVEMPSTRKQTTYTVKVSLDGVIYTARSSGDFWGYKPANMVVGTELEACLEANRIVIKRHDGKAYKPVITRRELERDAGQ